MLILIAAYLLGSIPFGYIVVWLTKGADVRAAGSGGTGATNVSRRAGKLAGIATLALDAMKGFAVIEIASRFTSTSANDNWLIAAAAIAAIVGHVFPVWLGFRGGKGVATGLGVFAYLAPVALIAAAAIFVCVVWLTRYVSLGSISAVVALPVCIWLLGVYAKPLINFAPLITTAIIGGALIIFMHRKNIERLIAGTENKFH